MPEELNSSLREAIILDLIELTKAKYVYPDLGEKIAHVIQAKLDQGEYNHILDPSELATCLTSDLRQVSEDRHWSVIYNPHKSAELVDPEKEIDEKQLALWLAQSRRNNFGFTRLELLSGNIGYIELREFAPSEYAGEIAVSAMNFVANCDALILDLRQNHGGYPSMVQLITSYLVKPEPVHINSFYYRPTGEIQQFWTFPHVPGKRMPDIPVYVLTSRETGSGAEEFAYNLKNMQRATIIGETTVGAAHPVTIEIVQENFQVNLPYGRPINPITNENWEGKGVEPDICVPQEESLSEAHLLAFKRLLEKCEDENWKNELEWELEIINSSYFPAQVDMSNLTKLSGRYGKRSFTVREGKLMYKHIDSPCEWPLTPISATRFRLDHDVKFAFLMNNLDDPISVEIFYKDGRPNVTAKRTLSDE